PDDHLHGRAEYQEQRHAGDDLLQTVDEMEAAGIDDPQADDAVMHGMETPEKLPFVRKAVRPIERKLGDHDTQDDLQPEWPGARPETVTRFGDRRDVAGETDDGAEHDQCLYRALAQQRMGDVGEGLAVVIVPGGLERHGPLEGVEADTKERIGGIE